MRMWRFRLQIMLQYKTRAARPRIWNVRKAVVNKRLKPGNAFYSAQPAALSLTGLAGCRGVIVNFSPVAGVYVTPGSFSLKS